MSIDEKNFNISPPSQDSPNNSFPFNKISTTTNNIKEFIKNMDYFDSIGSNQINNINEKTGDSSYHGAISGEIEIEPIYMCSKQSKNDSKDVKELFNQKKKEKIFNCKKTKRKIKSENKKKEKLPRSQTRLDNDRTTFVRKTLNDYTYGEVSEKLKKKYPILKINKIPEKLISKISLVSSKEYLNMKLISILEESKKYEKNKSFPNFDEIKNNPDIKEILEKTFSELAKEYMEKGGFEKYLEEIKASEGIDKANKLRFCGKYFAQEKTLFHTIIYK